MAGHSPFDGPPSASRQARSWRAIPLSTARPRRTVRLAHGGPSGESNAPSERSESRGSLMAGHSPFDGPPPANRQARSWRAIRRVECPERAQRVEGLPQGGPFSFRRPASGEPSGSLMAGHPASRMPRASAASRGASSWRAILLSTARPRRTVRLAHGGPSGESNAPSERSESRGSLMAGHSPFDGPPPASRQARSWRAIRRVECPERAQRVEGLPHGGPFSFRRPASGEPSGSLMAGHQASPMSRASEASRGACPERARRASRGTHGRRTSHPTWKPTHDDGIVVVWHGSTSSAAATVRCTSATPTMSSAVNASIKRVAAAATRGSGDP
jgi:hypothetical protein